MLFYIEFPSTYLETLNLELTCVYLTIASLIEVNPIVWLITNSQRSQFINFIQNVILFVPD